MFGYFDFSTIAAKGPLGWRGILRYAPRFPEISRHYSNIVLLQSVPRVVEAIWPAAPGAPSPGTVLICRARSYGTGSGLYFIVFAVNAHRA
jgi:hypothetical protein